MLAGQLGMPAADCVMYCIKQGFFATKWMYHEGRRVQRMRLLKQQRTPLVHRTSCHRLHITGEEYVLH